MTDIVKPHRHAQSRGPSSDGNRNPWSSPMAGLARQPHTLCSATVSEVAAWQRMKRGLDIIEGLSSGKQELVRKQLADRMPMAGN
jgi:hypothetical protein